MREEGVEDDEEAAVVERKMVDANKSGAHLQSGEHRQVRRGVKIRIGEEGPQEAGESEEREARLGSADLQSGGGGGGDGNGSDEQCEDGERRSGS